MAIDMFTTRTMLPVVEEYKSNKSFLRDRYFGNVRTFDTAKIDVDLVSGQRKMAPFVAPKIGGKTIAHDGYTTSTYEAPEVSPDMITTAEDILKRSPGENIYNAKSPNQRAAEQLGRDLRELDAVITRREEWMCAQALFTGKIDVVGEGVNDTISYWAHLPNADQPKTALASGSRWTDVGVRPTDSLDEICTLIMQKSGVQATDVVMGRECWKAFKSALSTLEPELNWRRVEGGDLRTERAADGSVFRGYFSDCGLSIYTYDEWFLDENGVEQPMVPANLCLIGSPRVRTTMAYGVVSLMRDPGLEFFAAPRVPDSWSQRKNPCGRVVQIKSRPLPIIHEIQGFHVLQPIV